MLTLPQLVLRDCHAVFRRALPRSTAAKAAVSVHVSGGPDGNRLFLLQPDVGIEYHHPAASEKITLTLPLDVLADCGGSGSGPVQFQPLKNGGVEVRWDHAGTPQQRTYPRRESTSNSFPAWPKRGSANEPSIIDALDHAMQATGDSSPRLSLNSIQLRGPQGDIIATDGRQLLVQAGFRFPWKEALLVPRTSVFAAKELRSTEPIPVAQSEAHLLVRSGCWTIALRIDTSSHFPMVDRVIPKFDPRATQWTIGEEEAKGLAAHLPYLPAADEDSAPVTLDLAKPVSIRARGEAEDRCTELALPKSRVTGKTARVATDRRFLQHALKLGFRAFQITDPGKPILCQDGKRLYVWVPLDPKGALCPQANDLRVALPSTSKNGDTPVSANSKPAVTAETTATPAAEPSPRMFYSFLNSARGLWRLVREHHQQDQAR